MDGNFEALRRRIRSAQEKDLSHVTEISQELLGGWQFRSAQEKDSNDVTVILVELPAPPPKNVEQVIYEYVDRKKVLYFLR